MIECGHVGTFPEKVPTGSDVLGVGTFLWRPKKSTDGSAIRKKKYRRVGRSDHTLDVGNFYEIRISKSTDVVAPTMYFELTSVLF